MIKVEPGREPVAPKHAATVVLLRDIEGDFEVFMVRRHSKSGFMGGAYVFPGGKLDDADCADDVLSCCRGRSPSDAAAALGEDEPTRSVGLFVAAIRETFEEAGVLLADWADDRDVQQARRKLQEHEPLGDVIQMLDARLRLDRITPWTRWVTPTVEPRRYDARFFLAVAPPDQIAAHDELETTEASWMTPAVALQRECAGEIQLPPPTLRSLEMLSAFGTSAEVLRDAESRTPPMIEPVFLDEEGTWNLLLPGDPKHPVSKRRIPGSTRFVLEEARWLSKEPPED